MAFVRPKDRVLETSITNHQTVFALAGAADASYNAFSSAMAVGDTTIGTVVEPGVAFKTGVLTYSAANEVTVSTTYETKGTFGAGTKEIFMGLPASRDVYRNGDQEIDGALTVNDTTDATSASAAASGWFKGGLAVAKKLFVGLSATIGGVFKVTDTTEATGLGTTASGIFSGGLEVLKKLYVTGNAIFSGNLLTSASTTARSGITVPVGVAPTSPAAGDIWNDGRDVKARLDGVSRSLTLLPNYLTGLTLSTAGSSATFGIAAGAAADDTNATLMVLASAYTKTTSAWAVGSGNGALDTGTIATSTWYHVWEIERPDTGVVDVLVSLSASAPTMPSNYTLKRYIGSMKTNGSSQWTKFTQFRRKFLWEVPVVISASTYPTGSRASLALAVPTNVNVNALFKVSVNSVGGGNGAYITSLVAETDTTTHRDLSSGGYDSQNFERITNTSGQIGLRPTDASDVFILSTYGWEDMIGN